MTDERAKSPTGATEKPARRDPEGRPEERPTRGIADGHTVSGEPLADGELVIEASEESFPASDPPCYMAVTKPGGPRR